MRPRPTVSVTTYPLWRLRMSHTRPCRVALALATLARFTCTRYAFDPAPPDPATRGPSCRDNQEATHHATRP
jgi:hypothetical protein